MAKLASKAGGKVPPYFPPGMTMDQFRKASQTGERLNVVIPYKLDKPQQFPGPGDLERRWYFNGRWYDPS
jgi:hypothetical protein